MSDEQLTGVIWVTQRKEHVDLATVHDNHLINIYKMLCREFPWRKNYIGPVIDEIHLRGLMIGDFL